MGSEEATYCDESIHTASRVYISYTAFMKGLVEIDPFVSNSGEVLSHMIKWPHNLSS